eukprot:c4236_g1_i1 orf=158-1555(-)
MALRYEKRWLRFQDEQKVEQDDLVVEESEPPLGEDVLSAGIIEQTQGKEEALGKTLREVMLAERPSTQGESQHISTGLPSKKIARRILALLPKRKLSLLKLQTNGPGPVDGLNTRHLPSTLESAGNTDRIGELNLLSDQSETTLGDLLMRAGASFASEYVSCRQAKRNGLLRILRFSGRVFCGSAKVDKDDCSAMVPLTASEEENEFAIHLIPEIISTRQGLISRGFLVENFAGERGESVDSGNVTTAGNANDMPCMAAQPIDEQCIRNSTQLSTRLAMADVSLIGNGWWLNREITNTPAHSPVRSLQGGNNTRLNTMLEESPMLAHNERRVRNGHATGAVEVRSSETFLVNRAEETVQLDDAETTVAVDLVGTPIRVSLMTLLQERDDMMKPLYPMANEECDKNWHEQAEGLDPMCCVCMVGRKGAAFVPCGHTYCRSCTRELWRARGACPLCNRSIIQILDIY